MTRGQAATEGITAGVHMSSPLPDEFMAPGIISFTVSCSFLEDQSVQQASAFVKREAVKAINPGINRCRLL